MCGWGVERMVKKAAIIGYSPENGHPFSFSAIVNGYNHQQFAKTNWHVILDYLGTQPPENFGFAGWTIDYAWTQDRHVTQALSNACKIPNPLDDYRQIPDDVEAVIIARDDWQSHFELAMFFLKKGCSVFVDKPLSLDQRELDIFFPYLQAGKLMSCSGLYFAQELEMVRQSFSKTGKIHHINATILNEVVHYGVHMLDAIGGLGFPQIIAITKLATPHQSFLLELANGVPVFLNCLGKVGKTFHFSVYGEKSHFHIDLHNNFMAFRKTLQHFFAMAEKATPPISPQHVLNTMNLLKTASEMPTNQRQLLV